MEWKSSPTGQLGNGMNLVNTCEIESDFREYSISIPPHPAPEHILPVCIRVIDRQLEVNSASRPWLAGELQCYLWERLHYNKEAVFSLFHCLTLPNAFSFSGNCLWCCRSSWVWFKHIPLDSPLWKQQNICMSRASELSGATIILIQQGNLHLATFLCWLGLFFSLIFEICPLD